MLRTIFIVIFLILPTHGHSEETQSKPDDVGAEQSEQRKQTTRGFDFIPAPLPHWFLDNPAAPIINVYTGKHADGHNQCVFPKNWTTWPAFIWCKSSVWLDAERVIALFTVILGIATWLLWRATANLVSESRTSSRRQLRAYVFAKNFVPNINLQNNIIQQYIFFCEIENYGLTPATDTKVHIYIQTFPMNEDRQPVLQSRMGNEMGASLGPRSVVNSPFVVLPIQTMREKWANQTEIFIVVRIEYRDLFEPDIIRHHQQSAIIELLHEPDVIPPPGHRSFVSFRAYGENTSS